MVPVPEKRDLQKLRAQRKEKMQQSLEDFNQKLLTDLQSQIDDMVSSAASRKLQRKEELLEKQNDSNLDSTAQTTMEHADTSSLDAEQQEKEKMLASVRQFAVTMGSDLKDLLKNELGSQMTELQSEKKRAETDRAEKIQRAKDDSKQLALIEREHQQKMDSLNSQLNKLEREKQKKEESVSK